MLAAAVAASLGGGSGHDGSDARRPLRGGAGHGCVRLLPAHARELRLAREASRALVAGDVTVDTARLSDYDELTGLAG